MKNVDPYDHSAACCVPLSNQRSYMTYNGFEKMANIVIYNTFNGLRHLNMYRMVVEFYCKLEYFI